jgi:hypothetical protein
MCVSLKASLLLFEKISPRTLTELGSAPLLTLFRFHRCDEKLQR